ncbi:MAG: PD40 domain-containing protein [Candidatus Omnitrophica bacterium]|nr:PD40 domain-containing protein [Candidatus Omnitrophota bacterium]
MPKNSGEIIQLLDTHFEQIIIFHIIWILTIVILIIAVRVRGLKLKDLPVVINRLFYYVVVLGEGVLLAVTVVVFFFNSREMVALDEVYKMNLELTTDWVKEEMTVYFIDGNQVFSIDTNGENRQVIFTGEAPIRSYHFSPDGKYIVIVSFEDIYLYNRGTKQSQLIASLSIEGKRESVKGVINNIAWSPDSLRFCYRISRWSKVSSRDNWYIYDLESNAGKGINTTTFNISKLVWNEQGDALYFSTFNALDTTKFANPFEVVLYEIFLAKLKPRIMMKFFSGEPRFPKEHLASRGIELFKPTRPLSFGRIKQKVSSWRSVQGAVIGIDQEDVLYYIPNRWWRKRLFRVPRVPIKYDTPRHQYKGGKFVIDDLRWLPSGKYLILEHDYYGICILDPGRGRIGVLDTARGGTFGWFSNK